MTWRSYICRGVKSVFNAYSEIESGISNSGPELGACSMNTPPMDRNWYAVSVFPRHEKQVAQMCHAKGVNYLLPLYSSVRRWKDRRKRLEMVLFPGYLFVNVALAERLHVLVLPGVARFVTFHGQPAVVPEREIKALSVGAETGVCTAVPSLPAKRTACARPPWSDGGCGRDFAAQERQIPRGHLD